MKTFLFSVAFLVTGFASAQKKAGNTIPWITIHQIATCKSDTFRIKAKVLDIYNCPPCPKGAECKPCLGDHLTVEDTDADTAEKTMVFVSPTTDFVSNSVYIFTLVLQNKYHPEFGNNLIKFERLKK